MIIVCISSVGLSFIGVDFIWSVFFVWVGILVQILGDKSDWCATIV